MPWGIFIPVDEEAPLEFRLFDQLQDYNDAVDGTIQAVDLDTPGATIYVNDDGKILGLPLNRRATLLLWMHNRAFHRRDILDGPAVLIGLPDEEGNTQDVPAELVDLLMKTDTYKVEIQVIDEPGEWQGNTARYNDWVLAYNAALSMYERWVLTTDVRVVPS